MNPNRALLIAVPVILVFVLALTYLRVFSSVVVIAVIVVLYVLVSLLNRRKFKKRAEERDAGSRRTGK